MQGWPAALVSDEVSDFVEHAVERDAVDYRRDYDYVYFGFKTLGKSYLLRLQDKIMERPQHMLMRVACGIHAGDEQQP
eukprot:867534-Lingulodinium_polyedra.AAC.1